LTITFRWWRENQRGY